MMTVIAMPCLDEEALIERAVQSLGFGRAGSDPPDCLLVVIDNGSTDGTLAKLEKMKDASGEQMRVVGEPQRGFVPARRRGIEEASRMAEELRVRHDRLLVLQADADTVYRPGYVAAMVSAVTGSANIILEGATRRPADFEQAHPLYVAAERLVDEGVEPHIADDEDEVVVDDKVCGFLLSDYLRWGGHREERANNGDLIHAETTRLFIRARLSHGARKLRVNPAGAAASRRRVEENPRLQFATAGFPREHSWIDSMARRWPSTRDVDAFAMAVIDDREREAVRFRRAHQLALFRYLPAVIAEAESRIGPRWPGDIARVLDRLTRRSSDEIAERPGRTITDILRLVETDAHLFDPGDPTQQ